MPIADITPTPQRLLHKTQAVDHLNSRDIFKQSRAAAPAECVNSPRESLDDLRSTSSRPITLTMPSQQLITPTH